MAVAHEPREVQELWSKYFDAGDFDALAATYEDGAIWVVRPGEVISGSDAITSGLRSLRAATQSLTIGPADVVEAGDIAVLYAQWTATPTGADPSPGTVSGTTSDVVRRQPDGTWLLAVDNPWLVPSALASADSPTGPGTEVDRDELHAAIAARTVTVVDALAAAYYHQQHLPGAVNLPADRVTADAGSLLPDKHAQIVVYCASTACSQDVVVAKALSALGYAHVRTYPGGIQDWSDAGLAVEHGPAVA